MWSVANPSMPTDHLGRVEPDEVLYQFDGPLLFTAHVGLSEMLLSKIEETESTDIFIATPTSRPTISALERGILSVRGAFGYDECYIVELDKSGNVPRYWKTSIDLIPEELLPDPGVGLDPDSSWVVDSIEQVDAYFSVRFSGDGLTRESIPFRTFMKLMESVYEASRASLAPNGLERARSTVFDFNIREPIFGSLIVTIDEPSADIAKVNKFLNRKDLTSIDVKAGFSDSRNKLFEDLHNLTSKDATNLTPEENASRYRLIQKIVELLPDDDTSFSKVEFNSFSQNGVDHVVIEQELASRIRDEHTKARMSVRTVTGLVKIINDKSATFVISADYGRDLTCHIPRAMFEELQNDQKFRNNSVVRVYGELNPRPRRDEIFVQHAPEILQAAQNTDALQG